MADSTGHRWAMALGAVLALGAGVLFAVAWRANRAQYDAGVRLAAAESARAVERGLRAAEQQALRLEQERFALFAGESGAPAAEQGLRYGLFTVREDQVVPFGAALPAGAAPVPHALAARALASAREAAAAGRQERAAEYLATALRCEQRTGADADLAAEACFARLAGGNGLDAGSRLGLCLLLDAPGPAPVSAGMTARITAALAARPEETAACRAAWAQAAAAAAALRGRPAPCRVAVEDDILAADTGGRACRYTIDVLLPSGAPPGVRYTTREPGADAAVIRSSGLLPLRAWLPRAEVDARLRPVRAAYDTTRAVLAVVAALAAVLLAGIAVVVRRERTLAALRSAFVTGVSHELRTPLSLIKLHADSLCRPDLPRVKTEEYARTISGEVGRLTGLVNNILDLSRLERGLFTPHVETLDVSALCTATLDAIAREPAAEACIIRRRLEPGALARTDRAVFPQVLYNLLDNALKYGGDDNEIDVSLQEEADGVWLRVADRGIGIPPELRARVFEPYVRGDDARVTAQRGSGIGLYVVRELLARTGGRVTVRDNVPRGTVIEVTLAAPA